MLEPIYEDNHLLVLNKPCGLLTQPSGTDQESLEQLAKDWIKIRDHKPGNVFLEAVHRLDRPVSGVVVFAKTSKALSRLNESSRNKKMRKLYWAWLEGNLPVEQGTLEHYLVHDDYYAKCVERNSPGAKLAQLNFKVLERKNGKTKVEIELLTGRYHQIRAQFSAIGFPIWGDGKYGGEESFGENAIALHHCRLELTHPVSQENLVLEAQQDQDPIAKE
jgi:23S rRNA pseudouridine1911/1915/1917 synthase